MLALAIVLRIVALLAFAGLMLLSVSWCRGQAKTRARQDRGDRAPLVANLTAFGLFFLSLLIFSSSPAGFTALLLALSGSLLALAGAALVVRSRAELGAAWSFAPKADQSTGLVTTGLYRLVRHPIYLGLALVVMGEALAFGKLAGSLYCAVGDRPDLGLARPRGGETAQPYIWRALRGLSTANQDDHPAPSLDPAHDVSTNRYAMPARYLLPDLRTMDIWKPQRRRSSHSCGLKRVRSASLEQSSHALFVAPPEYGLSPRRLTD